MKISDIKILHNPDVSALEKAKLLYDNKSDRDDIPGLLKDGTILYAIATEGGSKAFLLFLASNSLIKHMKKENIESLVQKYINEEGFFSEFIHYSPNIHGKNYKNMEMEQFEKWLHLLKINLLKNIHTTPLAKANILISIPSSENIVQSAAINLYELANHNSQTFLTLLSSVFLMNGMKKEEINSLVQKYKGEKNFIAEFKKNAHNLPSTDPKNWEQTRRLLSLNSNPYDLFDLDPKASPKEIKDAIQKRQGENDLVLMKAMDILNNAEQKKLLDEYLIWLSELTSDDAKQSEQTTIKIKSEKIEPQPESFKQESTALLQGRFFSGQNSTKERLILKPQPLIDSLIKQLQVTKNSVILVTKAIERLEKDDITYLQDFKARKEQKTTLENRQLLLDAMLNEILITHSGDDTFTVIESLAGSSHFKLLDKNYQVQLTEILDELQNTIKNTLTH